VQCVDLALQPLLALRCGLVMLIAKRVQFSDLGVVGALPHAPRRAAHQNQAHARPDRCDATTNPNVEPDHAHAPRPEWMALRMNIPLNANETEVPPNSPARNP